jgi:hypothetical protein
MVTRAVWLFFPKNKKTEKFVIFDFFVLEIYEKFDNLILNSFMGDRRKLIGFEYSICCGGF